jgi:hypothetical protein
MLLWGVKKKAARDADPRERGLWGDLMSIGMVFPIAILLGLFGGRWIGAKLGHQDLGQWIGLGLGIGAAFWELYKVSLKLDRYDAEAARSRTPPDEPDERP